MANIVRVICSVAAAAVAAVIVIKRCVWLSRFVMCHVICLCLEARAAVHSVAFFSSVEQLIKFRAAESFFWFFVVWREICAQLLRYNERETHTCMRPTQASLTNTERPKQTKFLAINFISVEICK